VKKGSSGSMCYYDSGYNNGWKWGEMEGWCKGRGGSMVKSKGSYGKC
jgi:hypothetical protein